MDRNSLKLPLKPDYIGYGGGQTSERPTAPRKKIEIRIVNDNNEEETSNKQATTQTIEPSSPRPLAAASMRKSRTSIVSLAHHQLRRRESALSLFALTASAEQKRIGIGMDYLNQLYEEKVRDQNELSSLMQTSSRLVKQQQQQAANRTPSGSFSLVSGGSGPRGSASSCVGGVTSSSTTHLPRRLSGNMLTPTLAQSTNHLLAKEEMDDKRRRQQLIDESLTVYNVFFLLFKALNFIILGLVRAGFVSKRVLNNLKQNFKIYLFIFVLFSVILAAIFFSLLKLFNKLKNRL